jgi:hypothetical protein
MVILTIIVNFHFCRKKESGFVTRSHFNIYQIVKFTIHLVPLRHFSGGTFSPCLAFSRLSFSNTVKNLGGDKSSPHKKQGKNKSS